MRITRVYTRTGDDGNTGLAGGERVPKDSLRVECFGTVDELNSSVGVVRAFNDDPELDKILHAMQNSLFDIGGILCTLPAFRPPTMASIGEEQVKWLEELMDRCETELTPLEEFILPAGGKAVALLHLSRTICRRAERVCCRLAREQPDIGETTSLKYLNRLSDALFVLARWVAKRQGQKEVLWDRPGPNGERKRTV